MILLAKTILGSMSSLQALSRPSFGNGVPRQALPPPGQAINLGQNTNFARLRSEMLNPSTVSCFLISKNIKYYIVDHKIQHILIFSFC